MRSIDRARWKVQYVQRVLATNPFAYFVCDEKQGSIAYDLVSGRSTGAQNGTIVGATPGQPGIGDGRTALSYDGANDYTDIWSAALAAAIDFSEGTVLAWGKTTAWKDGAQRRMFSIQIDPNNRVFIAKFAVNDTLSMNYTAGGSAKALTVSTSTTEWFNAAISWSVSLDEVRIYFNGVQQLPTLNGLGAWVGALPMTNTIVGAFDTTPTQVWDGLVNHVPLWTRALPPAEVESLYQESF